MLIRYAGTLQRHCHIQRTRRVHQVVIPCGREKHRRTILRDVPCRACLRESFVAGIFLPELRTIHVDCGHGLLAGLFSELLLLHKICCRINQHNAQLFEYLGRCSLSKAYKPLCVWQGIHMNAQFAAGICPGLHFLSHLRPLPLIPVRNVGELRFLPPDEDVVSA